MRLSRQRLLALLVLTSILLVTLDSRGSAAIDKAKSTFVEWMSPLQGVGRAISNPIRNTWRGITSYDDVERENDRLREINQSLEGSAIAGSAVLRSYYELAAQQSLETVGNYSNVIAQVLTYGPSNVRQTIEINKGSDQGIRVGMPTVNGAGLIGKVTQVSAKRCVILLISDPSYSVPVTVSGPLTVPGTQEAVNEGQPTLGGTTTTIGPDVTLNETLDPSFDPAAAAADGVTALPDAIADGTLGSDGLPINDGSSTDPSQLSIPATTTTVPSTSTTDFDLNSLRPRETGGLEGRGAGKLPIVRFIASDAKGLQIKVGDVVVTNGGSTDLSTDLRSLAPADLVIGRVSNVIERPGQAGPEVEVEPIADLTRLNFVRVLLYIPPSEAAGG